jgi:hypothetical protein
MSVVEYDYNNLEYINDVIHDMHRALYDLEKIDTVQYYRATKGELWIRFTTSNISEMIQYFYSSVYTSSEIFALFTEDLGDRFSRRERLSDYISIISDEIGLEYTITSGAYINIGTSYVDDASIAIDL